MTFYALRMEAKLKKVDPMHMYCYICENFANVNQMMIVHTPILVLLFELQEDSPDQMSRGFNS